MTAARSAVVVLPVDLSEANAIVQHVIAIVRGLEARRVAVEIVAPEPAPGRTLEPALAALGTPIHLVATPAADSLLRMFRAFYLFPVLARMARRPARPTFYIRMVSFGFAIHLLLRLLRAHTVSEHNGWVGEELNRGPLGATATAGALLQYLDALAAGAVRAVSPSIKDKLDRCPLLARKTFVAENGTDLKLFRPIERTAARAAVAGDLGLAEGRRYIGMIAHLKHWQGGHVAVAAMETIARKTPDIDLVIAGGGPELDALKRQAADLGVAGRVVFTGPLPVARANDLLNCLDIALAPFPKNRPIGSPVKLRNYCAAGCAVLASDIPQNLGELPDGVAAFHAADDPESLARRALDLMAAPDDRRRMSAAARALAEDRWPWRRTTDAVHDALFPNAPV